MQGEPSERDAQGKVGGRVVELPCLSGGTPFIAPDAFTNLETRRTPWLGFFGGSSTWVLLTKSRITGD